MKKLLIYAAVFIPVTSVSALFTDTIDHPYEFYINRMEDAGIISGYPDGFFRPNVLVNRAEFLKMLMIATDTDISSSSKTDICFFDFTGARQWFWEYVCEAKKRGIVDGHPDGTFRGETNVNLAEAVKMSVDAWKEINLPYSASDWRGASWYDPYFSAVSETGIFRILPQVPDRKLTRAEAAVVLTMLDPNFNGDTSQSSSSQRSSSSSKKSTNPDLCGNGILDPWEQCDDGNDKNNDGCSNKCLVVNQPVYHGALRIEQRPLSSVSVTKGAKDVTLLAFDAIAGRQNVFITQLKFASDTGSLQSATNYRLYYDRDGDGVAEKKIGGASQSSETLSFTNINIPVEDGKYVRVELKGDIRSSGTVESFSVQFASDTGDYVEGVDAVDGKDVQGIEKDNGACPNVSICWIAVYSQDSRIISIEENSGNLYVYKNTTPVRSRQLLGGELSDVLLRLIFRAEDEDMKITKIRIVGGSESVESLHLYEDGQSTPFAIARESACETAVAGQFCADTDFIVWQEMERKISVRAKIKADTQGGESGETVTLGLSSSTSGESMAIEAQGASSQINLSQNDGDSNEEGEIFIGRTNAGNNQKIESSSNDTVLAKINDVLNINADSNGSTVPTGSATFAVFRFWSANHSNASGGLNDVTVRKIIFSVTAENVAFQADSMELYNTADAGIKTSCAQSALTGYITVTCDNLQNSNVNTEISAGGYLDLAIRGTIENPKIGAGGSTLQAKLQVLGTRGSSGPVIWDDGINTFSWVDIDETNIASTLYRIQ